MILGPDVSFFPLYRKFGLILAVIWIGDFCFAWIGEGLISQWKENAENLPEPIEGAFFFFFLWAEVNIIKIFRLTP